MLYLRNLVFTILHPGIVAGLIPYWIIGFDNFTLTDFGILDYFGIAVLLAGLIILFACIYRFARFGKGTLSPADPTKNLVISGLYRYSRNPMYVGVIMILLGECLLSGSTRLAGYTVLIFLLFHLFILYFEEPRLERDFGKDYDRYKRSVRRWI